MDLKSADNSLVFTYGGVDEDGDVVIYVDSNAVTDPTPILCQFQGARDFLTDLHWDADAGSWIMEHGAQRGQLL